MYEKMHAMQFQNIELLCYFEKKNSSMNLTKKI